MGFVANEEIIGDAPGSAANAIDLARLSRTRISTDSSATPGFTTPTVLAARSAGGFALLLGGTDATSGIRVFGRGRRRRYKDADDTPYDARIC
jgi:hypothetical protein